jgi:hypothetical protein
MGLAGIVLATIFIEDVRPARSARHGGILLAGVGPRGLAFGARARRNFLPTGGGGAIVIGAVDLAYVRRTARCAPVLDLSPAIPSLRAAVLGGFIYRSGIGAVRSCRSAQLGFHMRRFGPA